MFTCRTDICPKKGHSGRFDSAFLFQHIVCKSNSSVTDCENWVVIRYLVGEKVAQMASMSQIDEPKISLCLQLKKYIHPYLTIIQSG